MVQVGLSYLKGPASTKQTTAVSRTRRRRQQINRLQPRAKHQKKIMARNLRQTGPSPRRTKTRTSSYPRPPVLFCIPYSSAFSTILHSVLFCIPYYSAFRTILHCPNPSCLGPKNSCLNAQSVTCRCFSRVTQGTPQCQPHLFAANAVKLSTSVDGLTKDTTSLISLEMTRMVTKKSTLTVNL